MINNIISYLNLWTKRGYPDGIPDEVPIRLNQLNKAPSYKAICIAILNNDVALQKLGMNVKKSKYYHELKRIELLKEDSQLKLF